MICVTSDVSRSTSFESALTSARSAFASPSASERRARASASRDWACARWASASRSFSSLCSDAVTAFSSIRCASSRCRCAVVRTSLASPSDVRALCAPFSFFSRFVWQSDINRCADWWRAARRATSSVFWDRSLSRACRMAAALRASDSAASSFTL